MAAQYPTLVRGPQEPTRYVTWTMDDFSGSEEERVRIMQAWVHTDNFRNQAVTLGLTHVETSRVIRGIEHWIERNLWEHGIHPMQVFQDLADAYTSLVRANFRRRFLDLRMAMCRF